MQRLQHQMSGLTRVNGFTAGILAAVSFSLQVLQPAIAQTKPPIVQTQAHKLAYGSFLGGARGDDRARGVGVLANGQIIVAGNFQNLQTRGATTALAPGAPATAQGRLLKLGSDGKVLAELTLGDRIDDLEVVSSVIPSTEVIAVSGSFGVALVSAANLQVLWIKQLPEAAGNGTSDGQQTRVAMARTGQIAVLRAGKVRVFGPLGTQWGLPVTIDRQFVTDVAIEPNGSRVYAVGFTNHFNVNDNNNPVQVAFLYGYTVSFAGLQLATRTWDYNPNTLVTKDATGKVTQNDMADTRLYRVVVGGDGKVAVIGEAAGGNNIFRWNGKDLKTNSVIKFDPYSDTFNSGSAHAMYFGKVNAGDGVVIAGSHAVPRLPGSKPGAVGLSNSFKVAEGNIWVEPNGTMHITGISAFGIPDRDANTFSGTPVGVYAGDDMVLFSIANDFKTRLRWTPFGRSSNGGGGTLNGVAMNSQGDLIVLGTAIFGELMTTPNALVSNPFDPAKDSFRDVYLGVVKTR
jgi:hypothetical protein